MPKEVLRALRLPGVPPTARVTWAELAARGALIAAARGKPEAFREAADRTEGKVAQAITGPEGGALPAPLLQAAIVIANMSQDELAGFVRRHELAAAEQVEGKQDA